MVAYSNGLPENPYTRHQPKRTNVISTFRYRNTRIIFPFPGSHLPPHPTPINSNNLPTHIGTSPTREPNDGALEIVRVTPPAHGDPLEDLPGAGLVVDQGLVHVRLDVAWGDGVDVDALAGPLVAQGLGQLCHPTFGTRVRRYGQAALEGHEAGDVDDGAAVGARPAEHVRPEIAAQREDRRQVDLHDFVPVAERELVGWMAPLDAGTGHQDRYVVAVGEDLLR